MTTTTWPAPAKLNLFLHITGRRPDGYHDLQTVFQLIDFCDDIDIAVREDGRIERGSGPEGVAPEADLVVRAARLLQAASGTGLGATISVDKYIPMGGGLGGGSSDAATVLLALNQLWGCGLSPGRLAELGAQLGSDVPVFVHGSSAWAEGRGEILTPVSLPGRWYVVLHPQVAVPTAPLFQAPELTRNSLPITMRGFLESGGTNAFEPVVRARYPEIDRALTWLGQCAPARLTGTGSCIFAPCTDEQAARRIVAAVPAPWRAHAARGLAVSPVHERLGYGTGG